MAWFKVDDKLYAHPKTLGISLSALGLWVKCGSYCADMLTDGFVPDNFVKLVRNSLRLAQELVNSGLWERTEGGYRFHDWDKYQPSKEKVVSDRQKNADKLRQWREARRRGE